MVRPGSSGGHFPQRAAVASLLIKRWGASVTGGGFAFSCSFERISMSRTKIFKRSIAALAVAAGLFAIAGTTAWEAPAQNTAATVVAEDMIWG
ncbi:hypothetical protein GCM10010519_25720 [Streptomyces lactacystinicus]